MGIGLIVLETSAAVRPDLVAWLEAQRRATSIEKVNDPETSSAALKAWFNEMRKTFPRLADADPDDLHGTDYNFYEDLIVVDFAGPLGEEGINTALALAGKHGLRILSDDLDPAQAPSEARKSRAAKFAGIAILDPQFAPFPGTVKWVTSQIADEGGSDRSSLLESNSLIQWNEDFSKLEGSGGRIVYFRRLILLRVPLGQLDAIAKSIFDLATKHRLGVHIFEDAI